MYEAGPAPATAFTSERAGFGRRLAAALLDGLIVGLVSGIFQALFPRTGYVIGILVAAVYFTYFEGGPAGAGLGKRAMRICVADFTSGEPIGYRRALIRYAGRIVSAVVFYVGYLWMLWDPERQCWHDKFANDVVVPVYE